MLTAFMRSHSQAHHLDRGLANLAQPHICHEQKRWGVQAHAGSVSSLSLSEDGWVLASAGRDSVVVLWDFRQHAKLGSIPVLEPVEGAAFLPASASPPRPGKKARTSGVGASGLAGLLLATAGSSGRLKVGSELDLHSLVIQVSASCVANVCMLCHHKMGPGLGPWAWCALPEQWNVWILFLSCPACHVSSKPALGVLCTQSAMQAALGWRT